MHDALLLQMLRCADVRFLPDRVQHAVELTQHLLIGEPHHGEASILEDCVALFVIGRFVDGPVDLDDQACRMTVEVSDESIDDLLPPEVQTDAIPPQPGP